MAAEEDDIMQYSFRKGNRLHETVEQRFLQSGKVKGWHRPAYLNRTTHETFIYLL
jgi:hypothetical protein